MNKLNIVEVCLIFVALVSTISFTFIAAAMWIYHQEERKRK